ncbi:MAG: DNA alkylation repair protein [Lachnospiraceae bacterium]|jgi:3-methyladenine DNA glycosylase AlkD|nr:DNA alkylation repair protein [Lachnospiraceae bacterium]
MVGFSDLINEEIINNLNSLSDSKYRDFQIKLIPGKTSDQMIGVRTPDLRSYAKELSKRDDISDFLNNLPHKYFDENQLHAFVISLMKDYDKCMCEVERFLPYVDNWATCDQMSPKIFKKNKEKLLEKIRDWIASDKTYTIRFGIKMLMEHFLDDDFDLQYPDMVASVRSEEYYVNMMIAWYFATALAKQYDSILPYIEEKRLDTWTHNKAIQKSIESYRITDDQKSYLRSLKQK